MIAFAGGIKVVVATQPVDFRRGLNGLVALIATALAADPYCGDVFVFRPKRRDRLRLVFWDGSGMVLVPKWLESGRFTWVKTGPEGIEPSSGRIEGMNARSAGVQDGAIRLTREEFALPRAGLDWTRVRKIEVKRPVRAA